MGVQAEPMELSEAEHLAVVDLEATCDDGGQVPKWEMEIIEIGAVMVTDAA
jgi:inhibitor of KinA sporulation pathway (predicted exonuclease)